jgi:FixJ family two-component response regulator
MMAGWVRSCYASIMMADSSRLVVAVVDDDPRTLESLADLLEAAGYGVRLYPSATSVWKRGGLSGIDCLITDVGMPDMDGFELRRLVLAERPALPVILITGRPELRGQHSFPVEPDRYFEKPFDGQRLLAAVHEALSGARPRGDA